MRKTRIAFLLASCLAGAVAITACAGPRQVPLTLASHVDLERFMGDWYVIANIPTFIEEGAHNAVESYRLAPDGTVATTFTFREQGFEGPRKRYEPTGFVLDRASNAVWGMRFVWPFKSDFRIAYLKPDYSQTIIGREARDYVWIMARTPSIPEDDYRALLEFLAREGYDTAKIRKVPQQWKTASAIRRRAA